MARLRLQPPLFFFRKRKYKEKNVWEREKAEAETTNKQKETTT